MSAKPSSAGLLNEPDIRMGVFLTGWAIMLYGLFLVINGPLDFTFTSLVGHATGVILVSLSGAVIERYMPTSLKDRFANHVPPDYRWPDGYGPDGQ